MRAVIQRVQSASVHVDGELISQVGPGILTLLGVRNGDTERELEWLIGKILALRIFEDDAGKMNRSIIDVGGAHLIVSQFTLWADVTKGNRPSFTQAASPEAALPLYEKALDLSRKSGIETAGGRFRSSMKVSLINDGPVTISIDTEKL